MDIECGEHPQAQVRYLRIIPMYRVKDWRKSVTFVCEECHEELVREKAKPPIPFPGQMVRVNHRFQRAA